MSTREPRVHTRRAFAIADETGDGFLLYRAIGVASPAKSGSSSSLVTASIAIASHALVSPLGPPDGDD